MEMQARQTLALQQHIKTLQNEISELKYRNSIAMEEKARCENENKVLKEEVLKLKMINQQLEEKIQTVELV